MDQSRSSVARLCPKSCNIWYYAARPGPALTLVHTQTMRTISKLETVEKEMGDQKGHFVTDLGSTIIYSGLEERKAPGVAHAWCFPFL